MKRPLLFGCICLALLIAMWTCYYDAPPFYSDIPVKEEEQIIVTGQLYQKEFRSYYGTDLTNLYLKSIEIIYPGTGQVLKINPKYKIICEMDGVENVPELGRTLRISGTWNLYKHASNPGQFDLANYYGSQYIVGKVEDCVVEAWRDGLWVIREKLFQLRAYLQQQLYKALPEKEASILSKMLLGVSRGLDEEVKALYQRNGIVHILSISGLHITMIGMGVYRILRRCTCPILPAAVMGAIFLVLYGCMTGFGISACRAIGMYLIRMLGETIGRSYDMLTAMGIMLAIMLMDNPRLIYHCGFLLSFASVAAVGCLYPVLPLQEVGLKKGPVPPPFIVRFMVRRFGGMLQALWASASISIFTMPIMLYYFYEIPIYSPFVNLLVLPFMGVLMTMGILLMIFTEASFLAGFEHIILNGYEKVCLLFEQLPFHTWLTGRPTYWQIAVYYAGILWIIWLCSKKCRWWSLGTVFFVLLLGVDFSKDTQVTFLDVGQGDCIVVMAENGRTYLFDGGSSTEWSVGEDIILPYLKYHGVSEIDGVFISHPDRDHISGILEILEENLTEIKVLYLPVMAKAYRDDFREIMACITNEKVVYYSEGDSLQTGDIRMTCVHPGKDFMGDANTYSGCFLIEIGDASDGGNASRRAEDMLVDESDAWRVEDMWADRIFRVLLTGDVEAEGERMLTSQLLERGVTQVHVLKVAHHGSRYSTSEDFLKRIEPLLAVISCGKDNSYGHPHEELLERLQNDESSIMKTPERGAITVKVGKKIVVQCWNPY